MHIGDNELNDYDESVLKTVKKCMVFQLYFENLPRNIHASYL